MSEHLDINAGLIPLRTGCELANRSLYTVRKWLREGKLTRYKRGSAVFLDPAELAPQPVPGPKRRGNGK